MNWLGIVVSFGFVFAWIGIAQALLRRGRLSPGVTRKVIHIGVAHWWLLAMVFFDQWEYAIVGPVAFIFINLASYLLRLFPAMEHEERRRNLGTVYFPMALLVCVLATWAGPVPVWMGGAGILVLGWGDGLASLVGEARGSRRRLFGGSKTLAGSLTMLVASAVVVYAFMLAAGEPRPLVALGTALAASVVELVTPFGLDNLTVPLVTMLVLYLV